jgi:predicted nucleic acid-binding protein
LAGIIFDSSVYIDALRRGDEGVFFVRSYEDENGQIPVWLSAVVLEELYAGAVEQRTQRLFGRMERAFDSINRLLVPDKGDWVETGKILNKIGERFGCEQIGKGRITNDTLIATSSARRGFTLVTSNAKDFDRINIFRQLKVRLI